MTDAEMEMLQQMVREKLLALLRPPRVEEIGASIAAHVEKFDHSAETPRLVEEIETKDGERVAERHFKED